MKKRLAFLLIAALLLSCLSGTALALDVGDACPYCQIGTLSSTITFAYNWGHRIYANCSNYQCGMNVLIKEEYHDLTGLTCWNGAKCPICHWDYLNPDNHEDFCKLKWITTATTHKRVWSACYKVEVAETAHNWSNGVCLDCDYVCEHDWSDKNGVCKICKLPCTNVPEGATCTTAAQCSVCSASHLNPNVHDDSCTLQWVSTSETTHKGVWSGCKVEVPEALHFWSNGQCKDCGYVCTHSEGTKKWDADPYTHMQYWSCCGLEILEMSDSHNWSNGQCLDCDYVCEHDWSDKNGVCKICKLPCTNVPEGATCTTAAQCSVCSASHLNPNVHEDSCTLQWVSTSATTHKGVWSACGKLEVPEAAHRWNLSNATCYDCNYVCTHGDGKNEKIWVSVGSDVHFLTWSCCRTYVDDNPKPHRWSDGKCSDCGEVCRHNWVNGVCTICKSTCAHDYDPATGVCRICKLACSHDKTAVDAAVAATCTAKGLTKGEHCEICGKVLKAQQSVKALGHCYGEWTDNGDGTHSAGCLRDGCGHVATVECAAAELRLIVDEAGNVQAHVLCPVCGAMDEGLHLERVEDALAVGEILPLGELTLRMGALQDDEMLMSVCFEYGGRITRFVGALEIVLPAELVEGRSLKQIAADGTETELAFRVDGDEAVLALEFADEEAEAALALIHLVPVESDD